MQIAIVLVSLLSFCFPSTAIAEPKSGSVGRYSDGRAYRVDNQGYQLSDQIAELEATIKEQELQISACENERGGRNIEQPKAIQCPTVECPTTKAPVAVQPTPELCSPFTSSLNSEISALRESLSKAPRPETVSALSEESIQLRQTLSAAEDNAKSALNTERLKAAKQENVNQLLTAKIAELTSEIDHKNRRENELLASIEKLSKQLVSADNPERATQSRGMLSDKKATENTNVIKITREESNADKATITTALSEIQRLIIKRKDLFDAARSSKRGVSIQMQQLVTENGLSLDQLRQKASIETSEFGALSHGLNEIKSILNADIKVMERLTQRL